MIEPSADYPLADAQKRKTSSALAVSVVVGIFALAVLWLWVSRTILPGELINPISPDLLAGAVFVGVFCSLLLLARIMTTQTKTNVARSDIRLDVIVSALILPTLAATACLRIVVKAGAFIGVTPQVHPAQFMITGLRTSRSKHLLRVRLGEGGREFSVPVRTVLYDAAQKGDTITLPLETGRFGVQRAMVSVDPADTDLHH